MIKTITCLSLLSLFNVTPSYGSSMCACTGDGEVIDRKSIPNPKRYVKDVTDISRESFERAVKVVPRTLKCQGHSCCPSEAEPIFVQKKGVQPGAQAVGHYGVVLEGDEKTFFSYKPGQRFSFKFFCADSAAPNGMVGGASFTLGK